MIQLPQIAGICFECASNLEQLTYGYFFKLAPYIISFARAVLLVSIRSLKLSTALLRAGCRDLLPVENHESVFPRNTAEH
jgi:hypothetical protein